MLLVEALYYSHFHWTEEFSRCAAIGRVESDANIIKIIEKFLSFQYHIHGGEEQMEKEKKKKLNYPIFEIMNVLQEARESQLTL